MAPGIGSGRELAWPGGLGKLVATDEGGPVDDQVNEQEPALAARQTAFQALAVPFNDSRPAQLDPRSGWHQGHANIVPITWAYTTSRRSKGWPESSSASAGSWLGDKATLT